MNRTVPRSAALQAVILIVAALLLISVFPARIWKRTLTQDVTSGGNIPTGDMTFETTLVQHFLAPYDRLSSVTVHVDRLEKGRYLELDLFGPDRQMALRRYYDLAAFDIPGDVTLPVNFSMEVGDDYLLMLKGLFSTLRLTVTQRDDSTPPNLLEAYFNDTTLEHQVLYAVYGYEQPLSKEVSLALMAGIVLIAALLLAVVRRVHGLPVLPGKQRAKGDTRPNDQPVTIAEVMRRIGNPLIVIVFGTLLLLIWPMKRFDDRLPDLIMLFSGILITVAFLLYGLNHRVQGEWRLPAKGNRLPLFLAALQAVCISELLWYGIDYMNATVEDGHVIAANRMTWALVALILLFGLPKFKKPLPRFTPAGILTAALFVLMIVFRNGRTWGIRLVILYGIFFLRFAFSGRRDRWLNIVYAGLVLNFLRHMAYCLLFRYYSGFITSRFAMRFHTVTVTAEYLTMMACAALVLFLSRLIKVYNSKDTVQGTFLAACWKEAAFLGAVLSYVIFTMSRTAYLAIFVSGLLIVCAGMYFVKRQKVTHFALTALAVVLCTAVSFPAVFSLQRILPAMAGHPVYYEVERMPERLRAGVYWDSRMFMSVERFTDHFRNKILGLPEKGYNYPEDRYNYDENFEPVYDPYGNPRISSNSGARRSRMPEEDNDSIEAFSNGRLAIFRAYLRDMNLTGHEEMGAVAENGEVLLHAHNAYLQVMYDHGVPTGIVFCLWLLALLVSGLMDALKKENNNVLRLLPFAVTAGFMTVGCTEWIFHFGNPVTAVLLLGIAPLLWKEDGTKATV